MSFMKKNTLLLAGLTHHYQESLNLAASIECVVGRYAFTISFVVPFYKAY